MLVRVSDSSTFPSTIAQSDGRIPRLEGGGPPLSQLSICARHFRLLSSSTIHGTHHHRIARLWWLCSQRLDDKENYWTWPVHGQVPPRISLSHLNRLKSQNFQNHTLGLSIMAIKTRLRLTLSISAHGAETIKFKGQLYWEVTGSLM